MRSVMLSEDTERAFLAAREAADAVQKCRFLTVESIGDLGSELDAAHAEFDVLAERRCEARRVFVLHFTIDMETCSATPQIPAIVEPS